MQSGRRLSRVLIVAGSDSGGGAGIQGDIKTVTCLGGYAATAITALTAQNSLGVFGIHEVPPAFIAQQMELVLSDIGADAVKTGMLHSAEVIETVAAVFSSLRRGEAGRGAMLAQPEHAHPNPPPMGEGAIPLILDPVMVAKGGAPLLQEQALAALKTKLLPLAYLVTPNIPEAELLSGIRIHTPEDMEKAARAIAELGPQNVLIKGGHLNEESDTLTNLLFSIADSRFILHDLPRLRTRHTHGTGCALASAIATGIAQGMELNEAVIRAQDYVSKAIENAPGLGQGHGPLGFLT